MAMSPFSATGQKSVQDARKRLTKYMKYLEKVPTRVLQEEARTMFFEVLEEVPKDTGRLAQNVYVWVSRDKRRPGIVAGASARDPKTGWQYAGIQHENTDFYHDYPMKAHFISDPFNRTTTRVIERLKRLRLIR